MTKPQLIQVLAERLNLSKLQAKLFLENLATVAEESLKKDGVFILPDMAKFTMKDKAATPERQGVNPFTKEPMVIPAKPATKKIHTTALVALKKAVIGD